MARYIDAVELMKAIEENQRNTEHHRDGRSKLIHVNEHRHFIKMVHDQPTADVAPKNEVDALEAKLAQYELDLHYSICREENAKSEVAKEIISEIAECCKCGDFNNVFVAIGYVAAANKVLSKLRELKNKYTEVQDE